MADIVTAERRSQMMSRVKSKDTSPELRVRKVAHSLGLRYRLHRKDLPGTPDIVFPRYRLAVFVHGCFWHQHPGCKRATVPKTAQDFWSAKFASNARRDQRKMNELEKDGWKAVVIWECETKSVEKVHAVLTRLFDL